MQNRPLYIIDGDGHTHYINMANSRSVGWRVINYSRSSSAPQVCFASGRGAGRATDSSTLSRSSASRRREDSGLLIYKEHLPVSQVAVGDTNRPGSEAKLTVGPLQCQGDSECRAKFRVFSFFFSFKEK